MQDRSLQEGHTPVQNRVALCCSEANAVLPEMGQSGKARNHRGTRKFETAAEAASWPSSLQGPLQSPLEGPLQSPLQRKTHNPPHSCLYRDLQYWQVASLKCVKIHDRTELRALAPREYQAELLRPQLAAKAGNNIKLYTTAVPSLREIPPPTHQYAHRRS